MPRKTLRPREKRGLPPPDYLHSSVLLSRIINKLGFSGKKSISEGIMYGALDRVKEKTKEDPMQVLNRAIENVRPLVEVRPRRVGGATYQVPMEVPHIRSISLAINWLLQYSREKTGRPMIDRFSDEIIAAAKREGSSFKKREDTHKMAEANKAFAHYRW